MNSDLYKFKSAVCIRFRKKPLRILMVIRGECQEIGKFYQNKNNGIQPLGITKNRMLKYGYRYGTNLLCFNRMEAKEFEKAVKKAMDMVDVFLRSLSFIIIPFSIQSIGTI
jgi:hypothetical protein